MNPSIIYKELVCVVHLANYYSWNLLEFSPYKEHLNLQALDFLGIEQSYLETIVQEMYQSEKENL